MDINDIRGAAERHGFVLQSADALPEIDGNAYVMRHAVSGARLLYLANDDNDKGFSITFKTPAFDDTGVFHILEHSVLCGSRKFPVKEPFVNLIKTSMQTFLNAMTFPDKTMYPVASTNDRDLVNLADVYMDAVFHPNIYSNSRIFEQEGWHFELDDSDGGSPYESTDADVVPSDHSSRLIYNGVVFNEMKGALSDAESVLYDTISAALFPDTTYRFESGGTPEAIPTLTYEGFLDAHSRHYRAENSYIVLYGNMDIDAFLAFLDDEYLSQMDQDAEALPEIALQSPVVSTGITREMATSPENSCAAYGYVVGQSSDRERMVAASVLLDAIMGSNAAPLKRALLDADIADDVDAFMADAMLQPFLMIHAKGLHDDAVAKLGATLRDTVSKLADGELDMKLVEAALSHAEFVMREGNFGYSDGVVYSMAALSGWLYEDDPRAATSCIRYEDVFASLREKLATSYFCDLLREMFLDNDHYAQAQIVPVDKDANADERKRLDALQSKMTKADLAEVSAEVAALREAQTTPDDPVDLAKLPRLTKADIGVAPHEGACVVCEDGAWTILRHEVETHGIVYATRYFDLARVAFEDLPYVTVLAMALGKMDTESHTASEIDMLQQSRLGSLEFGCDVFEDPSDASIVYPKFTVATSALSQNVEWAATLTNEILTTSIFHDPSKLYDILLQRKIALEQRFAMAGNSVAATRAASYYLPAAVMREQLHNIDFYVFLKSLIADFELRAEALADKLDELAVLLFTDDGCTVSFAGSDDDYRRYLDAPVQLGIAQSEVSTRLVIPPACDKAEAFIVPTDVSYTAVSADRRLLAGDASEYTGAWMVASRILTYSHLWNEVRVMGGAYGVGFSASRAGSAAFTSYRDPHIDETIERFERAGQWLGSFEPDDDEFEGYVVSTAASFDKPLKPRDLIRRQDLMHFSGYSRAEYLRHREEVVSSTLEDVRALGEAVTSLAEMHHVCVVGSKDIIGASSASLEQRDLLAL